MLKVTQNDMSETNNKKSLQAIAKSNYLKEYSLTSYNNECQKKLELEFLIQQFTGPRELKYLCLRNQSIKISSPISSHILHLVFNKIYPSLHSTRINSHSFINSFQIQDGLMTKQQVKQIVDIVVMRKRQNNKDDMTMTRRSNSYIKDRETKSMGRNYYDIEEQLFQVYIVHFPYRQDDKPLVHWETFVQKYQFQSLQSDNSEKPKYKINYSMICAFEQSFSKSFKFLNLVKSKCITQQFILNYFSYSSGNQQRLKKLQSYLYQMQLSIIKPIKSKRSSLPCYSETIRRQFDIPAQHFMQYKSLKQSIIQSYIKLNKQYLSSIMDYEMKIQQLVCRFLLEHQYDFIKATKALNQFLKWEYHLRSNFNMHSFSKFTDMDIFILLGYDRIGRPVLLFKTYNFIADQVPVAQDYINYIFYFIQIDCMKSIQGYIDNIIIMADCSNNSSRNLKIQVNTKMIPDGNRYLPRMFHRLILFNCSLFPYYVYRLAKPLLPTYSNQVIKMFKQNQTKEAFQQCLQHMDLRIIPQKLGGKRECEDRIQEKTTRVG